MKTKYMIGIVLLISILSGVLGGFGLAHFEYQPQIDSLRAELSQLNSTFTGLQSNFNALETNASLLQSENANLNSTVISLQSKINALETNASLLQSENDILNETVKDLSTYVYNMSLITDSSYYIYKQNNTYYAKSGLTGEIECQNDSCSVVINYTLTHVPYGGAVFFEPLASSNDAYYVDSAIVPPSGTTLTSENRMVTIRLDNNSAVQAVIDLFNVIDVQVSNIRIDGNNGNNATGCGIIIGSNSSYGSDDLVQNVVVDNCSEMGMWIQGYPLNNVVENVQVFHSGVYNVKVDSGDNKLISVESGWAGLSGFDVRGMGDYFLSCLSYGCGQANDIDGNGFSVYGPRNVFIACDGGANFQGGFVMDQAIQTLLEACVGRDNGRSDFNARIPGRWGFALYDSNSTILSECLSTDENDNNKTQDWGFTEGGNCDYNTVTGCNFEGNNIGAVFALVGFHSVITNTIGYETDNAGYTNFRYEAEPIDVGINSTFVTPQNFTSETGAIADFHVTIQWGSVSPSEDVTVMVQALLENGTTSSLETSSAQAQSVDVSNSTLVYALTQEDASELWSNSSVIQEILISAKTTGNTTGANVKVFVWGSGS